MVFMGASAPADQIFPLFPGTDIGHDQVNAGRCSSSPKETPRSTASQSAVAVASHRSTGSCRSRRRRRAAQKVSSSDAPSAAPRKRPSRIDVAGRDRKSGCRPRSGPSDSRLVDASRMPSTVEAPLMDATAGRGRGPLSHSRRSRRSHARVPDRAELRPASDSSQNSSSAPMLTPSAASEVAGVGVPSGAPRHWCRCDHDARRSSGTARLPAGCRRACAPRHHVVGHSAKNSYRPIPPLQRRFNANSAQCCFQRSPASSFVHPYRRGG